MLNVKYNENEFEYYVCCMKTLRWYNKLVSSFGSKQAESVIVENEICIKIIKKLIISENFKNSLIAEYIAVFHKMSSRKSVLIRFSIQKEFECYMYLFFFHIVTYFYGFKNVTCVWEQSYDKN